MCRGYIKLAFFLFPTKIFLFFGLFTKKKEKRKRRKKFPADTHTHIHEFIKEFYLFFFCTPTHYLIYPPHTVRANIFLLLLLLLLLLFFYVYPKATEIFFGSTESLALILRYIMLYEYTCTSKSRHISRGDDVEFIFLHCTSHLAQFHTHTIINIIKMKILFFHNFFGNLLRCVVGGWLVVWHIY